MAVEAAEDLLGAWIDLAGPAAGPKAAEFGRELIAKYELAYRRYHTTAHLKQVLRVVNQLGDQATDLDAVRYAAWFHDAVYEIKGDARLSNEERSARLAESVLTAMHKPAELVAEVGRLVRLTADHRVEPEDSNGAVLCDADLAILGAEPGHYARYCIQIREEYREIPDEEFRPGRAAILRALLDQDTVYRTELGRELFEAAARRNLAAELERLAPKAPPEPAWLGTARAIASFGRRSGS